jgi:hypothetical protein
MKGGFFSGAVGGLAIALLLIGLVALYPQANPSIPGPSTLGSTVTGVTSTAASTSSGCPNSPTYYGLCQGAAASSSPQPSTINPAIAGAQNSASSLTTTTNTQSTILAEITASGPTQQRPDSLVAVLPGEGSGSLIATISPLLLGLLVAALVYGAYVRRQDASS